MKAVMTTVCFLLINLAPTLDPTLDWKTDYEQALKLANKNNKNILIFFTGSDWCPPCIKLKEDLLDTEAFKELSDKYVLLYIDRPRNRDLLTPEQMAHNRDLAQKLNKKGVYPLLMVVNPKGKVLDEYSGYSMKGEIKYHLNFLKKNQ